MKFSIYILHILFSLIFIYTASAQQILKPIRNPGDLRFNHITEEQGLSSRLTYYILQDHYGFIWIATSNGLDCYNGVEIRTYKNNGRDPSSLPKALINSMFEDISGNLWICTKDGLSQFDRASETFHTVRPVTEDKSSQGNDIRAVHEDSKGQLWIFTGLGLYSFNPVKSEFADYTKYPITSGSGGIVNITYESQKRFLEDKEGNIWIGTLQNGLFRISEGYGEVMQFKHDPSNPQSLSDNLVTDLVEDRTGTLWVATGFGGLNEMIDKEKGSFMHYRSVGTDENKIISDKLTTLHYGDFNNLWLFGHNGFSKIDIGEQSVTNYELNDNSLPVIFGKVIEDAQNIWFAAQNGLYRFDKYSEQLFHYQSEQTDPQSLLRDYCFSMIEDKEGAIWINHLYPGVDRIYRIRKHFHSLTFVSDVQGDVWDYYIPFVDSDSNLWVGHRGEGIKTYSRKDYLNYTEEYHFKYEKSNLSSLSNNDIIGIYEDRDGSIWIGTENGLNKYDPIGKTFERYFESFTGRYPVSPVYEDREGNMWLGIQDNLVLFDRKTGNYELITLFGDDSSELTGLSLMDIYEDTMGDFWIATVGKGLLKVDRDDFSCIIYDSDPDQYEPGQISSNTINCIYEDRQGRLWVGTDMGLNLFNRDDGSFTVYTEEQGLENEYIFHIQEDQEGFLWLGTQKCISKFNPPTETFQNFYMEDGLLNNGFYFTSDKSPDGTLFFGGVEGVDYFYPNDIGINTHIPPVYITSLDVFNERSFFNKPVCDLRQVELKHNENDVTFRFIVLNYTDPERNTYACMLEGYDEDWIYCDARREARYTNIDPGEYVFRVKGSNNDGIWNEQGTSLEIIIHPPWWKTTIAFVSYVFLILLLLFVYIRLRTWRLRKEKTELEKQVRDRTRQIETQKEEIQSANEELAQQKEELEQQKEELQVTLDNLKKTQKQLIQSEKMAALGDLVAGVAHEINTPVSIGITAATSLIDETNKMVELYKQEKISRQDFREYMNSANQTAKLILSNMERTASMIQSFKQVSVDQSTEQKRKFKLKEYTEDIIRSLYPKLKEKKVHIDIEMDEKLKLNSFPGAYSQIITNLILNSLMHGFEKRKEGRIEIHSRVENNELILVYSDDGRGIPADILPKIYDPFFTTNMHEGTGLGMHIVYNLVRQKLSGTIECESEGEKGVKFELRLPMRIE